MEREDALKRLELIQTMVEQTRREVDRSGPFLVLWGALVLVASIIQHGLAISDVHHWIPYVTLWTTFDVVGIVGSIIIGLRLKRTAKGRIVHSVVRKIGGIWGSIFASILLMVALSVADRFPSEYIWPLATLFSGIGLMATGLFTEERIWIVQSILCLPLVALMFFYPIWQFLMFGLFFGISYIMIGMKSNRVRRREIVV